MSRTTTLIALFDAAAADPQRVQGDEISPSDLMPPDPSAAASGADGDRLQTRGEPNVRHAAARAKVNVALPDGGLLTADGNTPQGNPLLAPAAQHDAPGLPRVDGSAMPGFSAPSGVTESEGTPGDDILIGTSGDDVLEGFEGNDTLHGLEGDDTLDGGLGADTMNGGAGNDTYMVDNAGDVITELPGEGTDAVLSSVSHTLASEVENLTLLGSANRNGTGNGLVNVLTGNSGNNSLNGKAGADTMIGGAGNDSYTVDNPGDLVVENAGEGTDSVLASVSYALTADVENLAMSGSADIDGTGNDIANSLTGNSGNNSLDGGAGADLMSGRAGNDTYSVDNAGDVVYETAGEGTDTVLAGVSYTLGANLENLTLTGSDSIDGTGNELTNLLTGNTGNNALDGKAGADTMIGGAGNDTYTVNNAGDAVTENAGEGTDTVRSSIAYTLGADVENLTLTGSANIDGTGNGQANVLTGNAGDNVLDGKAGADTMKGGKGSDTYIVDNAGDTIAENASEGIDLVQSSVSFVLGADVENLTLTGGSNTNGTGNGLSNVLTGNAGNNSLDGKAGADSMIGGAGNDTYTVDIAGDVATENVGEGSDTVRSSIGYTLAANLENLTLTGSADIDGTGNELANVLTGNSGNNTLDGKAGADTMIGGAGNDTYTVDVAGDVVTENAGEGTDTVVAGSTYTLGADLENLTLTGSADINGTGNELVNVLTGNSGKNALDGKAGADTMVGGAGNDTYTVDDAGDVVTEDNGEGRDLVLSGVTYTLPNNVEDLQLTGAANLNGSGNDLDNVIYANVGDNVLDGGAGKDTASYQFGATAGVTAKLGSGAAQPTGGSGTDTLLNFENLTGSGFGDTLTGSNGNNVLDGGAGNDILDGLGGSDSVLGGSGADLGTYLASQNADKSDVYDGGTGDDRLRLLLTHAELNAAAMQSDIGAFSSFIAANRNTGTDAGPQFVFTAIGLKAANWESLELVDTSGAVWQKSTAPVTIGTAEARTIFTVGTNAVPATSTATKSSIAMP